MPTISLNDGNQITDISSPISHSLNIENKGDDLLYIFQIEGDLLTQVQEGSTTDSQQFPIVIDPGSDIDIKLMFTIGYKKQIPTSFTINTNEKDNESIFYIVNAHIPDPPEFSAEPVYFEEPETRTGEHDQITSGNVDNIFESYRSNYTLIVSKDHGLSDGDNIVLTNTYYYNGTYKIIRYTENEFEINTSFSHLEYTGTWLKIEDIVITDVQIWWWLRINKTINTN